MRSVAVIGAGPAGLAATRRLLEAGLSVTVFERRSQCGGNWVLEEEQPATSALDSGNANSARKEKDGDISLCLRASERELAGYDQVLKELNDHAPPSACYESLVNNIALPLMTFDGHSYPCNTSWFVSHQKILEYLQSFARQSGAEAAVRFKTSVVESQKTLDGKWLITSKYLSFSPSIGGLQAESNEDIFDYIVIGTGHCDRAHVPSIPGLEEWLLKWPGKVTHSKAYRHSRKYKDQTILLVGAGPSAFDLSREIAYVGKVVYQSVRTVPGGDPRSEAEKILERSARSVVPDNVLRVAEISAFQNPSAVEDMTKAEIHLMDGTTLTGLDAVIFCTGYRFSLPFLPDSQVEDQYPIISDGLQLHNLHKDMFYIPDPTLAFIGVQYEVSTFPLFDIEGMVIASVFAGRASLPSKSEMQQEYERRKQACGPGKQFHILGWERERIYMRDLAIWINMPEFHALVRKYEGLVQDVRSHQLETFKQRMIQTTNFRDQSSQAVKEMIERKTDEIQSAWACLASA